MVDAPQHRRSPHRGREPRHRGLDEEAGHQPRREQDADRAEGRPDPRVDGTEVEPLHRGRRPAADDAADDPGAKRRAEDDRDGEAGADAPRRQWPRHGEDEEHAGGEADPESDEARHLDHRPELEAAERRQDHEHRQHQIDPTHCLGG